MKNAVCAGLCVKNCPEKAIRFEQKAGVVNKDEWKGILVFGEQEGGRIHPVVPELIGEAKKLAKKADYDVNVLLIGGKGTEENARKLLEYGVARAYVYERPEFEGFKADCYADAAADCIAEMKPSVVLIGATPLGRSLAPRLFHPVPYGTDSGLHEAGNEGKYRSGPDPSRLRRKYHGADRDFQFPGPSLPQSAIRSWKQRRNRKIRRGR